MPAGLVERGFQPLAVATEFMSESAPGPIISNFGIDRNWDQVVAGLPHQTFFHSSAWCRVLQTSYDYRPFYLVDGEGSSRGCLPIMEVDSWITGRRGVSLPFTDECVPLGSGPDQARELLFKAIQLGRERGWRSFGSHGGGRLIAEVAAGHPSYFNHSVDLRKTPGQLFDSFSEANRRAIRKAQRSGVKVEMATDIEALSTYYQLHCLSRKSFGLPPQPWRLFQAMYHHVLKQNLGFILLARHEGRTIAGAVFCHSGNHAVFKFGASDRRHQPLRPNNLILWEAIQRLGVKGIETFSLGRTSLANDGLRRFKLSWGSTENTLWYLNYDCRHGRFTAKFDDAYGWHNRVFQRLPGAVSRLVGAFLYRHWA